MSESTEAISPASRRLLGDQYCVCDTLAATEVAKGAQLTVDSRVLIRWRGLASYWDRRWRG
jgi:hypothetical protein